MKIVIMAGGSGNRLWPKSVGGMPKQFLALTSAQTMLQKTYRSLAAHVAPSKLYVATAAEFRAIVLAQLPEMDGSRLIVEPVQRDTGPSVALAARRFLRENDDEAMITLPSDHLVPDAEALVTVLRKAAAVAESSPAIVTLGIVPTRPETNFGYVRCEAATGEGGSQKVVAFIEKPDAERAARLIAEPSTYWNAGIVAWRPSTIASAMAAYCPEIWQPMANDDMDAETAYAGMPKISIDYAVLEKAERLACIPVAFEWDDVGSWKSLERFKDADEAGNIVQGDALLEGSENSIVLIDDRKAIIIGVQDMIIVSTEDGLLVCRKTDESRLKAMVRQLESRTTEAKGEETG